MRIKKSIVFVLDDIILKIKKKSNQKERNIMQKIKKRY